MLQKGFVSGDPINHAVTMPVPAASLWGVESAHGASSPAGVLPYLLMVRADSI